MTEEEVRALLLKALEDTKAIRQAEAKGENIVAACNSDPWWRYQMSAGAM